MSRHINGNFPRALEIRHINGSTWGGGSVKFLIATHVGGFNHFTPASWSYELTSAIRLEIRYLIIFSGILQKGRTNILKIREMAAHLRCDVAQKVVPGKPGAIKKTFITWTKKSLYFSNVVCPGPLFWATSRRRCAAISRIFNIFCSTLLQNARKYNEITDFQSNGAG